MKRAALAIVSTVAALVLVLSYKTHSPSAVATPPAAVTTATGANTNGTSTTAKPSAKTYTGDAASTRYGPVQVQITVKNGTVTNAEAVVYPAQDPRDQQINSYAIPALNAEAVAAGSATIDMVSGATFTSEGYLTSLQSALDKAGL